MFDIAAAEPGKIFFFSSPCCQTKHETHVHLIISAEYTSGNTEKTDEPRNKTVWDMEMCCLLYLKHLKLKKMLPLFWTESDGSNRSVRRSPGNKHLVQFLLISHSLIAHSLPYPTADQSLWNATESFPQRETGRRRCRRRPLLTLASGRRRTCGAFEACAHPLVTCAFVVRSSAGEKKAAPRSRWRLGTFGGNFHWKSEI